MVHTSRLRASWAAPGSSSKPVGKRHPVVTEFVPPFDRPPDYQPPLVNAILDELLALRLERKLSWRDWNVWSGGAAETLRMSAYRSKRKLRQTKMIGLWTMERLLSSLEVDFGEFATRVQRRLESGD